ncbi:PH domain-containing protein [Lysobacter hankyongensis]|uniref:PH domain-containing protein n=1 Tax=Lysobacter hankyongensis TaxID=1176535 RepID=A0ABP9C1L5_9GAMM
MSDTNTLRAEFNPLVRPYMVLYVAWILLLTIVLSPLIVIWVLGLGQWWAGHYYRKLRCELDDRHLNFRKGILFQVEKTIPLDNIQDVTFIEGPLMRQFNLSILRIETAGQSPGQAHNMQLVGIVDAHRVRDEILRRRELLRRQSPVASVAEGDDRQLQALHAIRERLDEIAVLLRDRGNA